MGISNNKVKSEVWEFLSEYDVWDKEQWEKWISYEELKRQKNVASCNELYPTGDKTHFIPYRV